jgi:hypothetical protein
MKKKIPGLVLLILACAVLSIFLFQNLQEPKTAQKEIIKDTVSRELKKTEQIEGASVSIDVSRENRFPLTVKVSLHWPANSLLCVSYNYRLINLFGRWVVLWFKQTLVC